LRHGLAVVDDRAGDQLREEGDEQGIGKKAVVPHLAAVGIDQIGDLLEGEEGDREWQHDRAEVGVDGRHVLDRPRQKPRIFEPADGAEIERDAEREEGFRRPPDQAGGDRVVDQHRSGEQRQIGRVSPYIED
jgi:hypothetical protein